MNATAALPVVGVELAKSVLQLAVADGSWRVIESHRLTRTDSCGAERRKRGRPDDRFSEILAGPGTSLWPR